jgi:hypothetical protein
MLSPNGFREGRPERDEVKSAAKKIRVVAANSSRQGKLKNINPAGQARNTKARFEDISCKPTHPN